MIIMKSGSQARFASANSVFHNLPFCVRFMVFTYYPAPVHHLHVRPINGRRPITPTPTIIPMTQILNFVTLNISMSIFFWQVLLLFSAFPFRNQQSLEDIKDNNDDILASVYKMKSELFRSLIC
jgi:hypothetical protein